MDFGRITDPQAWKQAMARLLRRGGEVGEYIEQAPTKAGQAILDAGQRQSALMNEAFDPTGKTLIRNPQAANKASMNLLEGPLGFMPAGITAYHGSPYKFDKFDMTKVNKGEGLQAYGHGMYFAEAPDVAKGYATESVKMKTLEGTRDSAKVGLSMAEDVLSGKVPRPTDIQGNPIPDEYFKNQIKKYTEEIKQIEQDLIPLEKSLYKVDIPDEQIPTMMDWDKPLGEQSDFVKKAINNLKKQVTPEMKMELGGDLNLLFGKDITPNQFLNTWEIIHPTGGTGIGEKLLNEQGVKGIRYLDNTSRDAGKGTSNFVVFDPTDVKILERNNQPLSRKEILQEQLDKLSK